MAYTRGFSELNQPTCVVFFDPDKKRSKVQEEYPSITFRYLWDKFYLDIPRLRKLSLRRYLRRFVKSLQPGDTVQAYGCPDIVVALSKRRDITVLAERTELDEVSFPCIIRTTSIDAFHEACRNIAGIIVISQALKEYYIGKACSPDRVHVVNMIVDSNRFEGLQKQSAENAVVYCGTASNNKDGVDELIKAFALVVKTHPDYKLLIVGNTPSKEQRFDNMALAKELGIASKVIFTGAVPASDMPQLLVNANVLALDRPDNLQAKYGFPTKLGEYLLTGNPVVVTSVGDIPLFLEDGKNALISEPGNPEAFAAKLCWAIEHPDEAERIGSHGKDIALKYFNYLSETQKILSVLSI